MENKINPVPPKMQKTCVKILKQLFTSGLVIIGNIHLDFVLVNIRQ
jgi:hypothetical protein